jgi:hypothetical protein
MGKSYGSSLPETKLRVALADSLRRLAADHDGTALIVAKIVGSMMIEKGPDTWFKLSRISDLTGLSPAIVAGILHRLRRRGRLHFERRDGVDREYRFTIPVKCQGGSSEIASGAKRADDPNAPMTIRRGTTSWVKRSGNALR